MILSFTGTRKGLMPIQYDALYALLRRLHPDEVHHGAAIGADAEFHAIVSRYLLGPDIHKHPSNLPSQQARCPGLDNTIHLEKPPLDRNRDLADACEVLVACPAGKTEERRSGTWATVRHARRLGRRIYIVWNDGTVTEERTEP